MSIYRKVLRTSKKQEVSFGTVQGVYDRAALSFFYVPPRLSGEITIPAAVGTVPAYTFYNQPYLSNVNLEHGITAVGQSAFEYCGFLSVVEIPSTVTDIGAGAFAYCSYLRSIVLPWGVTDIGQNAFQYSGLWYIHIPATVNYIGPNAFRGCMSLSNIDVDGANQNYASLDGILYNYGMTQIVHVSIAVGGHVTVPYSVTSIDMGAFAGCNNIDALTLPFVGSSSRIYREEQKIEVFLSCDFSK